jgi:hypothetical protein
MKDLKIIILFIVVLSGCSEKYVDSSGGELIDMKIRRFWRDLDINVIKEDESGFSLSLSVKTLVEVADSVDLEKYYEQRRIFNYKKNRFDNDGGCAKFSSGCGVLGCVSLLGFYYIWESQWNRDLPPEGCVIAAFVPFAIWGLALINEGLFHSVSQDEKYGKAKPYYVQKDVICMDSRVLSISEVKVKVKNGDFGKIFHTDGYGNIELKFGEIIPEPAEADSVLDLIIRYYELVDSVEVRRL